MFTSAVALFDVCAHTSMRLYFPILAQHGDLKLVVQLYYSSLTFIKLLDHCYERANIFPIMPGLYKKGPFVAFQGR